MFNVTSGNGESAKMGSSYLFGVKKGPKTPISYSEKLSKVT